MAGEKRRNGTKWIAVCALCLLCVIFSGVSALSGLGGRSKRTGSAGASASKPASSGASSGAPKVAQSAGELRAVWVTSLANIDFPSKSGLGADAQKREIDAVVANVKGWGMNAIFLQVRASADALYRSDSYPWSASLTGTQGKDPGYDPLAYFTQQAHAAGLKLYAWVNPYRASTSADFAKLAASNPAALHRDWVVKTAENQLYFNPGLPEVRALVENGVLEITRRYPVDGVVFDDYFYPGRDFEDAAAYRQYGGTLPLDDWRRQNVTTLIREIKEKLGQAGSKAAFGVSPFAVWQNASSNPLGSDTAASVQSYSDQYADTRLWVQKKYVDFICPQIYWSMGFDKAAYEKVMDWWAGAVGKTGVRLYVAQTVSKVGAQEAGWAEPDQLLRQIAYSRKSAQYGGSAFFSYSKLLKNPLGVTDALRKLYTGK